MLKRIIPIVSIIFSVNTLAEVNENTGTMYLNHELFTVQGNSISLPINLTYSAGIGINQRASWVGLGFDLSLPYIERVPQGSVDEKDDDFLCNGNSGGNFQFYYLKQYDKLITETKNKYSCNPVKDNFTNQQDYYYLNAPFANGRIMFAQPPITANIPNNNVPLVAYLQNWRPVKIKYSINSGSDLNKWEITDENGIKYTFGGTAGIVWSEANIGVKTENTSYSYIGVDGKWITTEITTIPPSVPPRMQKVITSDHYVNPKFTSRWYLTEITAPDGEKITVSYTSAGAYPKIYKKDIFCYAPAAEKAATSLFRSTSNSLDYATFSFGQDNSYINPIYPISITGPNSMLKFCFTVSPAKTPDVLVQGDKKLEMLEIYSNSAVSGSYQLVNKIKLQYSTTAMHPFTGSTAGRLQLSGLMKYSADELEAQPLVFFEYASNPAINSADFYKHDFFGYYQYTPLRRSDGRFTYPAGQSVVGGGATPGAEAWSVKRAIYGNGLMKEYAYEPNVAATSSTNEVFATAGINELQCGVRVAAEKIYDGVKKNPVTTRYTYNIGYIGYRSAIDADLAGLYTVLNELDYQQISNIMVLEGTTVQYGYCKKTIVGAGSTETYFATPAKNDLHYYNTAIDVDMKDIKVTTGGLNSMAHCRGFAYLTKYNDGVNTSATVSSMEKIYEVKHDLYQYEFPEVAMSNPVSCALPAGEVPDLPPVVITADNKRELDYIGFVRLRKTTRTSNKVQESSEVFKFNATNGFPEIVKSINSDGKQKLTKSFFAFENSSYSTGMGISGANMLTQLCQSEMYEKAAGSSVFEPATDEIRSAQATTYAKMPGSPAWLPEKNFIWKANLTGGTLDATFADYVHSSSAANLNWQLTGSVVKYTPDSQPQETEKPTTTSQVQNSSIVYGYGKTLTIAAVTGAHWDECGVFTGDYIDNIINNIAHPEYWDYTNGWEKGVTCTVELTSDANFTHFGQKAIHVVNDFAAGRNNRIFPGKAYIMSAWVKVTSGTLFMASDYRYRSPSDQWPITSLSTISDLDCEKVAITKDDCAGQWKFMKLKIPASKTSKMPGYVTAADNEFYARAWIGNPIDAFGNTEGVIAYVDDIRFYPENAILTTTYYDQLWRKPILTVDAVDQPGSRITYDKFGRAVAWGKSDVTKSPVDSLFTIPLQTKKYHLHDELPTNKRIQVIYPNGGLEYPNSSKIIVRWVTDNAYTVTLTYIARSGPNTGTSYPISTVANSKGFSSIEWTTPSACGAYSIKAEISSPAESDESDIFRVKTPPNPLGNPSPSSGATAVPVTGATLSWTGGDLDGDLVNYDVYFSEEGTSLQKVTTIASALSTVSYTIPTTMTQGKVHYWKIVAFDQDGNRREGDVWNFRAWAAQFPVTIRYARDNGPYSVCPADHIAQVVIYNCISCVDTTALLINSYAPTTIVSGLTAAEYVNFGLECVLGGQGNNGYLRKYFKEWKVVSGGVILTQNNRSFTFTMPNEPVVINAEFYDFVVEP